MQTSTYATSGTTDDGGLGEGTRKLKGSPAVCALGFLWRKWLPKDPETGPDLRRFALAFPRAQQRITSCQRQRCPWPNPCRALPLASVGIYGRGARGRKRICRGAAHAKAGSITFLTSSYTRKPNAFIGTARTNFKPIPRYRTRQSPLASRKRLLVADTTDVPCLSLAFESMA